MLTKFLNHKIFEYKTCENYKTKANEAYKESPGKKVIFLFRQIVIIIGIKFINNWHHAQIRESKHQVAERDKNTCETIFRGRERWTLPRKKKRIDEPNKKAGIYKNRRYDTLLS